MTDEDCALLDEKPRPKSVGGEDEKLSVKGFLWRPLKFDPRFREAIKQRFGLGDIVASIVAKRQADISSAEHYLKPMISNSMPACPTTLKDMEVGVERILKTVRQGGKIAIFGDYDVDGATSTALLVNYFRAIGIVCEFHIPDRLTEGYGPNAKAFERFKANGVDLCLLVDCGTTAFEPLSHAREIDLDVIVIDHHVSLDTLPDAIAVINPNRLDEDSPYTTLAAVAVCFLLLMVLNNRLEEVRFFKSGHPKKPDLMQNLDLVAFGTVCDVMPLVGLNRAFVKRGLETLNRGQNLGISALSKLLSVRKKLESYHLGFVFGPRINAGGRIGDSTLGTKLLTSADKAEMKSICEKLNALNSERKIIEEQALNEATAQAASRDNKSVVVVVGDWHRGVLGLIASRLKDIYNLPSVAISFSEESDIGRGSCRSITGVDMSSAIVLAKRERLIVEGGGHKAAAGLSIHRSTIDGFRSFLEEAFDKRLAEIGPYNIKYFDIQADIHQLTPILYEEIEKLAPFGQGNSEPKIIVRNVSITDARSFGKQHISCKISKADDRSQRYIKSLYFSKVSNGQFELLMKNPRLVDIVGTLALTSWQDKEFVEFIIDDVIVNEI